MGAAASIAADAKMGGEVWASCKSLNDSEVRAELVRIRGLIFQQIRSGAVFPLAVKAVTDANFPRWFRESHSRDVLTEELYLQYCNVIGPRGYTFDRALQCGIDTKSATGTALPDEDSYYLWRGFYDKVIELKHGFAPGLVHKSDLDAEKINLSVLPDDRENYCIYSRIRGSRNISGYGLPPSCTRGERRAVEELLKDALLNGDLKGTELEGVYFSMGDLSGGERKELLADGLFLQKPDASHMLSGCGGDRDWPDARGVFCNDSRTFSVRINAEDHVRVTHKISGGNLGEALRKWVQGMSAINNQASKRGLRFIQDKHAGMLSSCLSRVGTGMRASMALLLPQLVKELGMERLRAFGKKVLQIKIESEDEVLSKVENGDWDDDEDFYDYEASSTPREKVIGSPSQGDGDKKYVEVTGNNSESSSISQPETSCVSDSPIVVDKKIREESIEKIVISNTKMIGITEVELVQCVVSAAAKLISFEKDFVAGFGNKVKEEVNAELN
eukprot:g4854.t1